ncbi:two-component system sensor histidine kinase CreC [Piscinibacter koreensis]|uniref:histidine kinase n=1 Tax=Piscinibacter koreensis TaxID=2742824 RepID=A0A7Y6TUR0_9BURK|nr:two-component system sensor histidine kinase CreC [Schlegelella koreensis]NUZ04248.1 two-component system sensor histidine kinase CreC [Schlegelella koreensis]
MTKRTRIFIGILVAYAAGVAFLMYRQLGDIDPRYRESAEESLVETAQLLAALVEHASPDGALHADTLGPVFRTAYSRRFNALIYGVEKTRIEVRATVVDRAGRVVFDSRGAALGADHSRWRDVSLALRGDYGARTTTDIEGDPSTAVMYVAVPVHDTSAAGGGAIIGAVSVGKPVQSFGQFVEAARRKTLQLGATSVIAVLLLVVILSVWLVRPFGLIADYVAYVRSQRSFSLPRLGRRALGVLGAAYDEMRDALAGRNYVADYVQTLTHEVKGPLSAIRGAAELLQEPMPDADRARFAANIARETARIQALVDRMMELTMLESRRSLDAAAPVALRPLVDELAAGFAAAARARGVTLVVTPGAAEPVVDGDAFLLQRAIANLIDNALDFSPSGSTVTIEVVGGRRSCDVVVRDAGPGIPEYAEGKVFEKFYSLARPATAKKSTGLGLSFVREIAELHHGRITLKNAPGGGAVATLSLPLGSDLD